MNLLTLIKRSFNDVFPTLVKRHVLCVLVRVGNIFRVQASSEQLVGIRMEKLCFCVRQSLPHVEDLYTQ